MTEHALMIAILVFVVTQVSFVGFLAYQSSKQIEGLTAATFLEARRVLSQYRP
jgi:hypothetical protein